MLTDILNSSTVENQFTVWVYFKLVKSLLEKFLTQFAKCQNNLAECYEGFEIKIKEKKSVLEKIYQKKILNMFSKINIKYFFFVSKKRLIKLSKP